jgi:TonB family protein
MKTPTARSFIALFGFCSLLAAGTAAAQVGPIQPVLVLPDGKVEINHDRPSFDEDYSIPLDVYVAADGSVTDVEVSRSSGNINADAVAAKFLRERKFLPALDVQGKAEAGVARVTLNMFKRGNRKVARVIIKPPPVEQESERVRQLMCADFLWEMDRIKEQAGIRDASLEVMPYMSARLYMTSKNVPSEIEEKFWDNWPGALKKVVDGCKKDELKFFFAEVLVPTLDGAVPMRDTATAAAQ